MVSGVSGQLVVKHVAMVLKQEHVHLQQMEVSHVQKLMEELVKNLVKLKIVVLTQDGVYGQNVRKNVERVFKLDFV